MADVTYDPEVYEDTYTNMELYLDHRDSGHTFSCMTKQLKDAEDRPIGTANDNTILDTRMYEVEYSDGYKTSLAAYTISENLFAQVYAEGNRNVLFDTIVNHRTNRKEVKQQKTFTTNSRGVKRQKETKKGWEMLVQWKDGSTTWVALKDMKEAYPVQAAEYEVENRISLEPAYVWWAPYILKKRNRIIAKVKSKYWVRTHKYGIEIPKNADQAKTIDENNGNNLWWDSIVIEMKKVCPYF